MPGVLPVFWHARHRQNTNRVILIYRTLLLGFFFDDVRNNAEDAGYETEDCSCPSRDSCMLVYATVVWCSGMTQRVVSTYIDEAI